MTAEPTVTVATADVSPAKKYGMLAWTVAGLVIAAYWTALQGDGKITLEEWLALGVIFIQGVATYLVPQTPRFRFAKNLAAGFIAVLGLGAQFWTLAVNGPTQQSIGLVVITFLTAAGALVLPAVSDNGVGSGLGASRSNPVA